MLLKKFVTFYHVHHGDSLTRHRVSAVLFHLNYCNHKFKNLVDS